MTYAYESLFPSSGVEQLRCARGSLWAELVEHVVSLPSLHPDVMAFTLMIRRLQHDLGLDIHTDCVICVAQAASRFEGSDDDLMGLYMGALDEINAVFAAMQSKVQAHWVAA